MEWRPKINIRRPISDKVSVLLAAVLTVAIEVCFGRSVCQDISDDIHGNFGLQEVNECYRCQGWFEVNGEASSVYSPSLNQGEDGVTWCPLSKNDSIQVVFNEPTKLSGLRIRSTDVDGQVKTFHVSYADENGEESHVRNRLRNELFRGVDEEGRSIKEHKFFLPVKAKSARLHVESYEFSPCLIVQFYSCDRSEQNQANSYTARQQQPLNDAPAGYHGSKNSRRQQKSGCSIDVKKDCGDFKCLIYLKDEAGCDRCECDRQLDWYLEGDIRVDSQTRDAVELEYGVRKDPENLMRNGITNEQSRWIDYPFGRHYIIPVAFDSSLEKWAQDKIVEAMREMERVTCILFRNRTNQQYFLSFHRGLGCSSYIGNIRLNGGQKVSIGNGCEQTSVVQHEILHALGFWHEQSRGDRDDYVKILKENIKSGTEGNFEKRTTNNLGSSYDFQSIMHYGNRAFSKNGEDTIQAIDDPDMRLGTSDAMTEEDISQVNKLYQCQTTSTDPNTKTTTVGTTTFEITTTTSTTTTTDTTTTKASTCEDNYQSCPYWTSLGFCKKQYVGFMTDHCKKSCGLCGDGILQECKDQFDCTRLKDFCQSEGLQAFMGKRCSKTCNMC